ncbi:MobP2 family relaxase [Salicibibacter kimchii]|uniref:Relaxase n=1 Tax=Salicibibacter kimchii TaxID=2099786 RepID=A0A345C0X2_9BACI|nr:MobP2 family relaxase [Salicibibacter kimchii]AXF56759.1 hypothetical protein DT065_12570 [Salicibibacter kimchii]AXF56853.1 hypothetical protein DT065_13130 [Salicibibacter kimchii]
MSASTITPGVVLKTKFITSNTKAFDQYVNYVDREEAKGDKQLPSQMFSMYNHYMDDPEKTSALFTDTSDRLNTDEKDELKHAFQHAQENKSLMWQDVITFDNQWLEKQGIYDQKTGELDEKALKNVTRSSMQTMLKKEGLEQSSIWSAAIHRNTDNIHIHVATVEPEPTRERGKRKPKTLDAMKGEVVNGLQDRSYEREQINQIIRGKMVDGKKEQNTLKWQNREMKPLFKDIYERLPENKRHWNYGYNTLNSIRPMIDQLTTTYLDKHHPEDLKNLHQRLDREMDEMKAAYGDGPKESKRFENYKSNKIDDLYKRMGNAFLKEMKSYDNQLHQRPKTKRIAGDQSLRHGKSSSIAMQQSLNRLNRSMKQTYQSYMNDMDYERLERDIERER